MRYALLGTTGVSVSSDLLGHRDLRRGARGPRTPMSRSSPQALDLGINFIDTADVYGNMPIFDRPGALPAAERDPAEETLGRA